MRGTRSYSSLGSSNTTPWFVRQRRSKVRSIVGSLCSWLAQPLAVPRRSACGSCSGRTRRQPRARPGRRRAPACRAAPARPSGFWGRPACRSIAGRSWHRAIGIGPVVGDRRRSVGVLRRVDVLADRDAEAARHRRHRILAEKGRDGREPRRVLPAGRRRRRQPAEPHTVGVVAVRLADAVEDVVLDLEGEDVAQLVWRRRGVDGTRWALAERRGDRRRRDQGSVLVFAIRRKRRGCRKFRLQLVLRRLRMPELFAPAIGDQAGRPSPNRLQLPVEAKPMRSIRGQLRSMPSGRP